MTADAIAINRQTQSYSLVEADSAGQIVFDSENAVACTIDAGIMGIGEWFIISQAGAGATSFVAGTGVTFRTLATLTLTGTGAKATATQVDTNVWELSGELGPVQVPGLGGVAVSGGATAGQVLTATSTTQAQWETPASPPTPPPPPPPPATSLAALTDVNITEGAAINGKALLYDQASGKWIAGTVSTTGGTTGSSSTSSLTYTLIRDKKPHGTDGGSCPSTNIWLRRDLTEIAKDGTGSFSLSGNQITVPAGTYNFRATSQAISVARFKIRLRDVTNNVTLGSSVSYAQANDGTTALAEIFDSFTVSANTLVELQIITQSAPGRSYDFGASSGQTNSNDLEPEIYSVVEFWGSGGSSSGATAVSSGSSSAVTESYVLIRDKKASGTDGGNYPTPNVWQRRDLTEIVHDDTGHASISSNQITLAAGSYRVRGNSWSLDLGRLKLRLRDVTNSVTLASSPQYGSTGNSTGAWVEFFDFITVAAGALLELQIIGSQTGNATYDLGSSSNHENTNDHEPEIYSVLEFWSLQPSANYGGSSSELRILIANEQPSGTGGGSANASSWNTVPLTALDYDDTGSVSLSANQFTLPAGTYEVYAYSPVITAYNHKLRLTNVTDTTYLYGTSEWNQNQSEAQTASIIDNRFKITAQKTFKLEHYLNNANNGSQSFGVALNVSGVPERYAYIKLSKVA